MKFFIIILVILISNSALAQSTPEQIAEDSVWKRLLSYKEGLKDHKSEADGLNFFLAPNGRTNPLAEVNANIHEIFEKPLIKDKADDHARCRFPARAVYLSEKLNRPLSISEDGCIEFQKFKQSFNAESISLVFSAYYINNPSSTFGHTFLRVNKPKGASTDTELLDLGVNFAANPWTMNPIIYTFGGIVGTFPGIFSTMPYYYKVREYNDFESRDLWSYQLDLTKEEIDQFIRHLWELGQTHYDYFFFTENCSYHIFTALETAAPRFDLSGPLPYWAIPSDTILIANQTPGLVKNIHFRPSIRNVFLERYNRLNKNEKEAFLDNLKTKSSEWISLLPKESQLTLIDTNIDWLEYKHHRELQDKNSAEFKLKNELLVRRTKFPPQTEELKVPEPQSKPHNAHPSMRYGLEFGNSEAMDNFQRFHLRFALHDLLDPDYGYPENMQVEFFNIQLQSYENFKKWDLHNWTLVSVKSIAPMERFEIKPTWDLSFGVQSYRDEQCEYCQAAYLTNSWGLAYDLFPKFTIYALASGDFSASQKYKNETFRAMIGPKLGMLYKAKNDFKFLLEGVQYWDPFQEYDSYKAQLGIRKGLSKTFSISASATIENDILESSIQLFWYQ